MKRNNTTRLNSIVAEFGEKGSLFCGRVVKMENADKNVHNFYKSNWIKNRGERLGNPLCTICTGFDHDLDYTNKRVNLVVGNGIFCFVCFDESNDKTCFQPIARATQ